MTRTEIARKLHDMVDAWLDGPLHMEGVNMAIRLTFGFTDSDEEITLVVGTETPPDDPLRHDADDDDDGE